MEKNYRILEFIRQGASWQSNLAHELVDMKVAYGSVGTKKILAEELAKYGIGSLPKGSHLMRFASVVEKLQKKNIPRAIYDQIPLRYWMVLIKYVINENAQEMVDYLHHQDGQLKILEAKLKQGDNLRFNLFSGEYEFIETDKKNENI